MCFSIFIPIFIPFLPPDFLTWGPSLFTEGEDVTYRLYSLAYSCVLFHLIRLSPRSTSVLSVFHRVGRLFVCSLLPFIAFPFFSFVRRFTPPNDTTQRSVRLTPLRRYLENVSLRIDTSTLSTVVSGPGRVRHIHRRFVVVVVVAHRVCVVRLSSFPSFLVAAPLSTTTTTCPPHSNNSKPLS